MLLLLLLSFVSLGPAGVPAVTAALVIVVVFTVVASLAIVVVFVIIVAVFAAFIIFIIVVVGVAFVVTFAMLPSAALVVTSGVSVSVGMQQLLQLRKSASHVLRLPCYSAAPLGVALCWGRHPHVKSAFHQGAAAVQQAALRRTHREAARDLALRLLLLLFFVFLALFV